MDQKVSYTIVVTTEWSLAKVGVQILNVPKLVSQR